MNDITTKIFLISVFSIILFAVVLSKISSKLLIKLIKKKYSDETIICEFKIPFIFTIAIPFGIGAFIGGCMIPFLLFKDLSAMGLLPKIGFIYFCIMMPFIIFMNLVCLMHKVVVTNKRIVSINVFKLKWWELNFNFMITDIKNIRWQNAYDQIIVTLKNNKEHRLGGYKSSKNCYEKIKKLLELENKYDNKGAYK